MTPRKRTPLVAQAWIEPIADDPEATSALTVARARLAAAARLVSLRRLRLIELAGPLPDSEAMRDLLHRSIQFYNPHKERCTLRPGAADPTPVGAGEPVMLVSERGQTRRAAAERWWLHETGQSIEVREGVAWVLGFEPGAPAAELAKELAIARSSRHGLFCNPHAQDARLAAGTVPLPWLAETA